MTEAVIYLRVSGESQIQGDGLPRQRLACLKYAAANEIEVASEFADEGVTGKMELESRAGLSACIEYVRTHNVKLVLVEDSTRLARDLIVAEIVIREFQKIGVRVVAASGGVDLTEGDDSNPTAKLIRQILAAVSEFERCCIVMKLRGARDRIKAETGRCDGRKPYGMHEGEAATLSLMRTWRQRGATYQDIADKLNEQKVLTRGGHEWRFNTIGKILGRY
jgi:DNA invertase Pin-like site-specific DNA recombinase